MFEAFVIVAVGWAAGPAAPPEVRSAGAASFLQLIAAAERTPKAGWRFASIADAGEQWLSLFDGKTLEGWRSTNFGGEGEVRVDDGRMVLEFGDSLTGVSYGGEFPRQNYEIRLEAMRVDGHDFFCGLTFPVGQTHCSLIVGGWAGAVVGLSSIDGKDASENATTKYLKFERNRWYKIRVRVTSQRIGAWIDEKQVVDQPIAGHKISIRSEVDPSKPLGIAAWQTRAALRNIAYRRLPAEKP
jgi:hypothetical protein